MWCRFEFVPGRGVICYSLMRLPLVKSKFLVGSSRSLSPKPSIWPWRTKNEQFFLIITNKGQCFIEGSIHNKQLNTRRLTFDSVDFSLFIRFGNRSEFKIRSKSEWPLVTKSKLEKKRRAFCPESRMLAWRVIGNRVTCQVKGEIEVVDRRKLKY